MLDFHHERAPTLSYVFPNYPPPLQASEVGLRQEAHIGRGRSSRRRRRNVFIADIKGWLVSRASIGHQAGRFKKGHGKPRTSTDMLMAIAKNVNCDNIYFLCVLHDHSNNFTQNKYHIVDIWQ